MGPVKRNYLIAILVTIAVNAIRPGAAGAENGSLADAYRIIESKQFVDLTSF